MADQKISDLTAAAALDGTELVPTVQGGTTLKTLWSAVLTYIKANLTKSDVGLGNVPNTDATNASNISSGTLAAARGGAGASNGILKANGSGVVSAATADTDYLVPATAASTYQPLDADLTALAGLDATAGYLAKTAANTYARRTLTGTANRITITNGDGTTGNPVLDIGTNVATLAGSEALTNKTYNGNSWTAGTGTLAIGAGKTATVNNTLTFAGTDGTTMTFPSTTATIARTDAANTFTGVQTMTSPALTTPVLGTPTSGNLSNCTADGTNAVGFLQIPQNSKSAAYTTVLADGGKHIYHPSADTTARTWTIDSNANVAYPVGTAITFVNDTSGGVITIAITSDTLVLAGAGTTGSRSLAANGVATAIKMTSTRWIISGTGLT